MASTSQVKSNHLYLYSAFNNTHCVESALQYHIGKLCVNNAKVKKTCIHFKGI